MDRIDLDSLIATWKEPITPDTAEDLAALDALIELFADVKGDTRREARSDSHDDACREAVTLMGWEIIRGR